jgi:hypothetical protein
MYADDLGVGGGGGGMGVAHKGLTMSLSAPVLTPASPPSSKLPSFPEEDPSVMSEEERSLSDAVALRGNGNNQSGTSPARRKPPSRPGSGSGPADGVQLPKIEIMRKSKKKV